MREKYEEEIRIGDKEVAENIETTLSERQAERKAKLAKSQRRKKTRTLIILLLAFVLMATMCGRDIIRLKAENAELKKQQVALEKQRDELKEELKNTGESEYIREQARKQLRLLNPGEILFTFDDEERCV